MQLLSPLVFAASLVWTNAGRVAPDTLSAPLAISSAVRAVGVSGPNAHAALGVALDADSVVRQAAEAEARARGANHTRLRGAVAADRRVARPIEAAAFAELAKEGRGIVAHITRVGGHDDVDAVIRAAFGLHPGRPEHGLGSSSSTASTGVRRKHVARVARAVAPAAAQVAAAQGRAQVDRDASWRGHDQQTESDGAIGVADTPRRPP